MTHLHNRRRTITSLVLFACTSLALATVTAQSGSPRPWWSPGQGTPLANLSTYDNERGQLGVLNASGQLETKGHPFFEPLGALTVSLARETRPVEEMEEYAQLQALCAHAYQLRPTEFEHILGTFPLIPEDVRRTALDAVNDFH